MPGIETREVSVALDMHGCPNRCRHCYLGNAGRQHMTEEQLRWAASQFRSYLKPGEDRLFLECLQVAASFREPDYSDDYVRLYELETKLGDHPPYRFELLSIWRLARDPGYAEWAKKVGPDTCQITFFGIEQTNDWFYRRRGAFHDCITATERLLDVGIKPRWQLFLTKKILPDLGGLLELVYKMRLRERVEALGSEFVVFMHPPAMDGEGRKLAHLNVHEDDLALIPSDIVESTKKHFKTDRPWVTEAEVVDKLINGPENAPPVYRMPEHLWFLIRTDWDVFANIGTLEPWWKLGNLKADPVEVIFGNFENDRPLGYQANYKASPSWLAEHFGDPNSRMVVNGPDGKWLAEYCEAVLRGEIPEPR